MISLILALAVIGLPVAGMAERRGLAAAMIATAVLAAVVAYLVYAYLGLGPCDGDGGVTLSRGCGLLPLAFPFAPLAAVAGSAGAYALRRAWPLALGLLACAAMVVVPAYAVAGA